MKSPIADPFAAPVGPAGIAVRVLLFAQLKDRFGADELSVSLPRGATGRDLLQQLIQQRPAVEGLLTVSRLAVNCDYTAAERVLEDGDEVVVIPPVSGG